MFQLLTNQGKLVSQQQGWAKEEYQGEGVGEVEPSLLSEEQQQRPITIRRGMMSSSAAEEDIIVGNIKIRVLGIFDDDRVGDTPSQDSTALSCLYVSTGGPEWTRNANWMSGDPCTASWHGVNCSTIGSDVTGIILQDNGLAGSFPSEIGLLTALVDEFDFSSNDISGSVPTEFGLLTALTDGFYLKENSFVFFYLH